MTSKYVRSADQLHFVATAAHSSGDVVVVGDTIGIAASDAVIGDDAIAGTVGTFGPLPILATNVTLGGEDLYWDAGNSRFTTTAGTLMHAGKAGSPSPNGTATVDVILGLAELV